MARLIFFTSCHHPPVVKTTVSQLKSSKDDCIIQRFPLLCGTIKSRCESYSSARWCSYTVKNGCFIWSALARLYCNYASEKRYICLSPYSPDFNPIELWWSQLKSFLRKFVTTTTAMIDQIIAVALELMNPQHLRNWFTHCCYCTS